MALKKEPEDRQEGERKEQKIKHETNEYLYHL
jgi:hypothetical protein